MGIRVAEFITDEDCSVLKNDMWEKMTIPKGTFVKPIEVCYLPKHIKDGRLFKLVDFNDEVYVYSSYGIHPILRKSLRRIE